MNSECEPEKPRDFRFAIGLVSGAVIGAGLAMWFGPGLADALRRRAAESAQRVGEVVDGLTNQGQDLRDGVADAVARGARHVERSAMAAKSHREDPAGAAV